MGKNIGFLIVGIGAGFLLANLLNKVRESEESPERLMESLDSKFRELESSIEAANGLKA